MLNGPNIALASVAVAFAAMGLGAIAAPERVTSQFDIPVLSANGRNEVRAVYGGFGIAMAAMLAFAFTVPALREGVCFTAASALGGMAAGRMLSALWDRQIGRWPAAYFGIECVGALLLLYAT